MVKENRYRIEVGNYLSNEIIELLKIVPIEERKKTLERFKTTDMQYLRLVNKHIRVTSFSSDLISELLTIAEPKVNKHYNFFKKQKRIQQIENAQ